MRWTFDPRRPEKAGEAARKVGLLTAIPTMMVVGPVGGYLLGAWLEGRFGGAPWLGFGGIVLGTMASVRQVFQILKRSQSKPPRKPWSDPGE